MLASWKIFWSLAFGERSQMKPSSHQPRSFSALPLPTSMILRFCDLTLLIRAWEHYRAANVFGLWQNEIVPSYGWLREIDRGEEYSVLEREFFL